MRGSAVSVVQLLVRDGMGLIRVLRHRPMLGMIATSLAEWSHRICREVKVC
jgi:hypothetical protein